MRPGENAAARTGGAPGSVPDAARRRKKFDFFPYLINIPMLLYLFGVMAFALGWGLITSFTNKTIGNAAVFNGLTNYKYLLTNPEYLTSIAVTLKFTLLALLFKLIFGTGMALTLNQKFRFRNAVRALLLIPWSLPNIVAVLNWKWIFSNNSGIANYILKTLGIVDRDMIWTGVAGLALIVILVADVWRGAPFFGISILAKLQTISNDYYEAAMIDGAGPLTRFFKITIPFVKDTMMITTLMSCIWTLNSFETIWLLTGGGPRGATTVMNVFSYKTAMSQMMIGRGLAVSVIAMPFLMILIQLISRKTMKKNAE